MKEYLASTENIFEKDKKDAVKKIKSILGDFDLKEDIDILLYIQSQLETILNIDYNNGNKEYKCCELSNVYFKLKGACKDFEKSCLEIHNLRINDKTIMNMISIFKGVDKKWMIF